MADESPRTLLTSNLDRIDRIARGAARRHGFTPEQSEDFCGWVWLRLVEDDFGMVRKFRGKSSLSTYLHAVIGNLAKDFRIREWGKWRPSAKARRLGPTAVELEQLLHRDELTFDAAAKVILQRKDDRCERRRLGEILEALPSRRPRRRHSADGIDDLQTTGGVGRKLEDASCSKTANRLEQNLKRALRELSADDREALSLRFLEGRKVVSIAREMETDQRRLYGRIERALKRLRKHLERHGVSREDLRELLAWRDSRISLSGLFE